MYSIIVRLRSVFSFPVMIVKLNHEFLFDLELSISNCICLLIVKQSNERCFEFSCHMQCIVIVMVNSSDPTTGWICLALGFQVENIKKT